MEFVKGQIVFHKNKGLGTFIAHDLHDNESVVAFTADDGYVDELRITTSLLIPGAKQKATNVNIDDLIDEWHESDTDLPLHTYLGLTFDEYKTFVECGELIDTKRGY